MLSKNLINQFLFALIIILAIVCGWAVSEMFKGNDSELKNEIKLSFSATNHLGKKVTEQNYQDLSKVFFFGFTHCPDICPISANLMSNVIDELNRNKVQMDNIFNHKPLTPLLIIFKSMKKNHKLTFLRIYLN